MKAIVDGGHKKGNEVSMLLQLTHQQTRAWPLPLRMTTVLRASLIAVFVSVAAAGNAAGDASAVPTAGVLTPITWNFTAAEGQTFSGIAAVFTDTVVVAASNFTSVMIDWGDGTPANGGGADRSGVNTKVFFLTGTHTYAEEGTYAVSVTFHDNADSTDLAFSSSSANVEDAPLCACAAPIPGGSQEFSGVGGAGALSALHDFEAAVGGPNNGANPVPQPTGFRTLNWDGVALDGTDFGGNSTTIVLNKTVGIPVNRFQERGALFSRVNAVASDGFSTVNPGVVGVFAAFSPNKDFAPINTHEVDISFVLPSAHTTTAVAAGTRGFGGVFINVRNGSQTSIEYFAGPFSLGKFYLLPSTSASPLYVFQSVLYNQPIVTRVHLTLGSSTLFHFDGTSFLSGAMDNSPLGANVVALDDLAYAEPGPLTPAAERVITPTVNTVFSGTVGTFSDTDPNGNPRDLTALINWGDGHASPGHITAGGGGGFNVSGSNTYATGGTFAITFSAEDFGGARLTGNAEARVPPQLFLPAVLH